MIPEFQAPYDWQAIYDQTGCAGAVVLKQLIKAPLLRGLNKEIDEYLTTTEARRQPDTGSRSYNEFLGHHTIRLHGLCAKLPTSRELIANPAIVEWAEHSLDGRATSVLLNAGELIEIQPGEPRQAAHRDSDSWPLPIASDPVVVNAIFALDDFTLKNGATWVAPGSWNWESARRASEEDYVRAIMCKGDALLFRGDLIHRGGENKSGERRRAISVSYCAGWLRPVENSFLNLDASEVSLLSPKFQALLGYAAYDGGDHQGGLVGLYENGDPQKYFHRFGDN